MVSYISFVQERLEFDRYQMTIFLIKMNKNCHWDKLNQYTYGYLSQSNA